MSNFADDDVLRVELLGLPGAACGHGPADHQIALLLALDGVEGGKCMRGAGIAGHMIVEAARVQPSGAEGAQVAPPHAHKTHHLGQGHTLGHQLLLAVLVAAEHAHVLHAHHLHIA